MLRFVLSLFALQFTRFLSDVAKEESDSLFWFAVALAALVIINLVFGRNWLFDFFKQ